jgi:exodeoxyribonuclease VII large subunit
VISAVGHEIDVTLADLVADVRALTPSEAAELVVPSADEIRASLDSQRLRLIAALRARAFDARARLDTLAQHRIFRQPFERVHDLARELDDLEMRATRAMDHQLTRARDRLAAATGRLESLSPLAVLGRGYSVTQQAATGEVVTDAGALAIGETLTSRLAHGEVTSQVTEIATESDLSNGVSG